MMKETVFYVKYHANGNRDRRRRVPCPTQEQRTKMAMIDAAEGDLPGVGYRLTMDSTCEYYLDDKYNGWDDYNFRLPPATFPVHANAVIVDDLWEEP